MKKSKIYLRNIFKKLLFRNNLTINKSVKIEDLKKFFSNLKNNTKKFKLLRLGEKNDGGYFIPDDLIGIKGCLSAGIGNLCGFENDLALKKIDCFMADHSINFPPKNNSKFFFLKKFISNYTDKKHLSVIEWVHSSTEKSKDYILKLDVEGDEYRILESLNKDELLRFRIVIVEFHHFSNILNPFGYRYINLIFKKVLKYYTIVKIHPTIGYAPFEIKNLKIYDLYEVTFLRKDRI